MNILINGISSNSAGGKTVITNLISEISKESNLTNNYSVICTKSTATSLNFSNIELIIFPDYCSNPIYLFFLYFVQLHFIIFRRKIDILLNLADFIVPTFCKQVYYFDWAYAVYPESVVWKSMDSLSFLKRKTKVLMLRFFLKRMYKVIVQTSVIESRMRVLYDIDCIVTIPNSFSFDYLSFGEQKEFDFDKSKFKFLYLTKFYDHKNFEIILALAELICERCLNFEIIITIDGSDSSKARFFLDKVRERNLYCLVNIGNIDIKYLGSLYGQVDCSLMPSHLESFSASYLEAILSNKPILASNYDFAREICEKYAIYFDPFDVNDLYGKVKILVENNFKTNCDKELIIKKYKDINSAKLIIESLS